MDKLKSSTGCQTCRIRRKKCDESRPICGECARLRLPCVKRGDFAGAIDHRTSLDELKSLVASGSSAWQQVVSNGHPGFASDRARAFVSTTPYVFSGMISRGSDAGFRNLHVLGQICTESLMVRDAMAAFASYGAKPGGAESEQVLVHYNNAVRALRADFNADNPVIDSDLALAAMLFLGILEGLKIGDPSNCLVLLERCREILAHRLSRRYAVTDAGLTDFYRIVAECVVYNLATLSPFYDFRRGSLNDWDHEFDCIFPENDESKSPFLVGAYGIYRVMFKTNLLLLRGPAARCSTPASRERETVKEALVLEKELDRLESGIPLRFRCLAGREASATLDMYRAKHLLNIIAVRIHLFKIRTPSATPADQAIRDLVAMAIANLRHDFREPMNPSMRWPFTVLACACNYGGDFDAVVHQMREIATATAPADRRRLETAYTILIQFRDRARIRFSVGADRGAGLTGPGLVRTTLDYLLRPRLLLDYGEDVFPLPQQQLDASLGQSTEDHRVTEMDE